MSTKKKYEIISRLYDAEFAFYQFKKGEAVASVGAVDCSSETSYGMKCDSLHFILENINKENLTQDFLKESFEGFQLVFNRKSTSTYKIIYGSDSSTTISSNSIDKIIVENSFHEFSEPNKMLNDFERILKPSGKLFLEEMPGTPKYPNDEGCGMKLYTLNEIESLFASHHFGLIRTQNSPYKNDLGVYSLLLEFNHE